jgi:Arc/MetJ-type ribon-helix-helix transcriptional regulator
MALYCEGHWRRPGMHVEIGGRFRHAIAEAIESGNYSSPQDVVTEAMQLFIARQAKRQAVKDSITEALGNPVFVTDDEIDQALAATDARLRAEGYE